MFHEIEATYIITDDVANVIACNDDGTTTEFTTERDAVKRATKELTLVGDENEIWIWKLSHVLSKTSTIDVEEVA